MLIHLQYDSYEVGNKLKEEYKLDDPVIKGIMAANTASHEAVVTAINQGLDEMEKRVATKGDIAELDGQIGDLKGNIGDLKGQIGDLKGDIGSLKWQVATFGLAMLGVMITSMWAFLRYMSSVLPSV